MKKEMHRERLHYLPSFAHLIFLSAHLSFRYVVVYRLKRALTAYAHASFTHTADQCKLGHFVGHMDQSPILYFA